MRIDKGASGLHKLHVRRIRLVCRQKWVGQCWKRHLLTQKIIVCIVNRGAVVYRHLLPIHCLSSVYYKMPGSVLLNYNYCRCTLHSVRHCIVCLYKRYFTERGLC